MQIRKQLRWGYRVWAISGLMVVLSALYCRASNTDAQSQSDKYILNLSADPDVSSSCYGDFVTFTATLTCKDPMGLAEDQTVTVTVDRGTGPGGSGPGWADTPVHADETGYHKIEVTASVLGGACPPVTKAIDVTKAEFSEPGYAVPWVSNGTFDAKARLTTDSYDKENMTWTIDPQTANISSAGLVTFGTAPGQYTITATPAGGSSCAGTCTLYVLQVEVKAGNGTSTPATAIGVGIEETYKAKVTPAVTGVYSWTKTSTKITLVDATSQAVTVVAGGNASSGLGTESIKVQFTPEESTMTCDATHALTVVKPEIKAQNGTSTPATAMGVWQVVNYKCTVSPAAFTVADADFAWGKIAPSDKITMSDSAKQTCTVTAGPDASGAVDDQWIQVIFTPQGSDQACAMEPHSLTVVEVNLDHDLWWFNGQNPGGGYYITGTLTATPVTAGSFQWDVIAGQDKVNLNNGGADADSITAPPDDPTVVIKSTNPSTGGTSYAADVTIQLTYNGTAICPYYLAVFAPDHLVHLNDADAADATWGYSTRIHYRIEDQFNRTLPHNVPINEDFTAAPTPDCAPMDWRRGPPDGATVAPADWNDHVGGETNTHTPTPVGPADPGAGTTVYHWPGTWSVGSTTVGSGVTVAPACVWQKYRGYARHE